MDFSYLYDSFESQMNSYAAYLSRSDAEDLVQETFLRALSHFQLINQLNDRQRLAWMRRTMKNLYLDHYRANLRRVGLAEQIVPNIEASTEPVRNDVAKELVNQLPDAQRTLVEMRYIQGLNSREIGAKLGIPATTVRSRKLQQTRA